MAEGNIYKNVFCALKAGDSWWGPALEQTWRGFNVLHRQVR